MKMKKISFLILLVVVLIGVTSCEPTYEKEYNWAYPVSGDWMVKAYTKDANGALTLYGGPYEVKTYNSAYGQDSIWVDDYPVYYSQYDAYYGNFWTMQVKAAVNMKTKTFETSGSTNNVSGYPINIKITNGKLIGNDSISMDVVYGDDPGNTYVLAGHRETGYDEYVQK